MTPLARTVSRHGLEALNFFVSALQTGFGPFVSVWLFNRGWSDTDVGVALSVGTIAALIAKRVKAKQTVVLCSHGPVIPEIIRELAGLTQTPLTTEFGSMGALSTGEFSVLHISAEHPKSGIVALETHTPEPE